MTLIKPSMMLIKPGLMPGKLRLKAPEDGVLPRTITSGAFYLNNSTPVPCTVRSERWVRYFLMDLVYNGISIPVTAMKLGICFHNSIFYPVWKIRQFSFNYFDYTREHCHYLIVKMTSGVPGVTSYTGIPE
jgi:hypothetical protein